MDLLHAVLLHGHIRNVAKMFPKKVLHTHQKVVHLIFVFATNKIFAAVTWGPLMCVRIQTDCSYNRFMANVFPLIII
jgi:hypothetical protein